MKRSGLLLMLLPLLILLAACSGSTTVMLDNQTVCGTIRVDLTNTQTGNTDTYEVPVGETLAAPVQPNVTYDYVVDYTVAENDEGFECTAIQRGQVTVPNGSTVHINMTAVTPTPSES